MQIIINTDNHIQDTERLSERLTSDIASGLAHVADNITRVEVHLSIEGGTNGNEDKRCAIEARMRNFQPVVAVGQGSDLDLATRRATTKLLRVIEGVLGRVKDKRGHQRIDPSVDPESAAD